MPARSSLRSSTFRSRTWLAAEREELRGEVRGAPAGAPDLLEVARSRGSPGLKSRDQQLDVAEDDREHVVEVVGHAAGEPPDGLHLLRLTELLLRLAELALRASSRVPPFSLPDLALDRRR